MIKIDRIHDMGLVRDIMTMPRMWDAMTDDGFPSKDHFWPQDVPSTYYLGVWDDSEFLGMFILYQQNCMMADSHIAMLPNCGGSRALKAQSICLDWIWSNTPFRRIITATPSCNRLGLKFARLAGFVKFGLNQGAWLKNGQLYDLVLSGVNHG